MENFSNKNHPYKFIRFYTYMFLSAADLSRLCRVNKQFNEEIKTFIFGNEEHSINDLYQDIEKVFSNFEGYNNQEKHKAILEFLVTGHDKENIWQNQLKDDALQEKIVTLALTHGTMRSIEKLKKLNIDLEKFQKKITEKNQQELKLNQIIRDSEKSSSEESGELEFFQLNLGKEFDFNRNFKKENLINIENKNHKSTLDFFNNEMLQVKKESLQLAQQKGVIGPRKIENFELKDVNDNGNCFFEAIIHQLQLIQHDFLTTVPEGTAPHDSLRSRTQGKNFNDREWVGDYEGVYEKFIKKLNIVLAIIDTRNPEAGFVCYYFNKNGEFITNVGAENAPPIPNDRPIIRLAATGNHYLSVLSHPKLNNGALTEAFKVNLNQFSSSPKIEKEKEEENPLNPIFSEDNKTSDEPEQQPNNQKKLKEDFIQNRDFYLLIIKNYFEKNETIDQKVLELLMLAIEETQQKNELFKLQVKGQNLKNRQLIRYYLEYAENNENELFMKFFEIAQYIQKLNLSGSDSQNLASSKSEIFSKDISQLAARNFIQPKEPSLNIFEDNKEKEEKKVEIFLNKGTSYKEMFFDLSGLKKNSNNNSIMPNVYRFMSVSNLIYLSRSSKQFNNDPILWKEANQSVFILKEEEELEKEQKKLFCEKMNSVNTDIKNTRNIPKDLKNPVLRLFIDRESIDLQNFNLKEIKTKENEEIIREEAGKEILNIANKHHIRILLYKSEKLNNKNTKYFHEYLPKIILDEKNYAEQNNIYDCIESILDYFKYEDEIDNFFLGNKSPTETGLKNIHLYQLKFKAINNDFSKCCELFEEIKINFSLPKYLISFSLENETDKKLVFSMSKKSGKFIKIIYQQDKTYKVNFYFKKEKLEETNNKIVKINQNDHQDILYLNLCELANEKKPFPIVLFSQSISNNVKKYDIKLINKNQFILFSCFQGSQKKEEIPANYKLKFHICLPENNQEKFALGWKIISLILMENGVNKFKIVHNKYKMSEEPFQAGKDITIYAHKNPDFSVSKWADIIFKITQQLIENQVEQGFQQKSDEKKGKIEYLIIGNNYVSYRYDGEQPEEDFLKNVDKLIAEMNFSIDENKENQNTGCCQIN